MRLLTIISLLSIGLYAYALAVLIVTRHAQLLQASLCGCLFFALIACKAAKNKNRVLTAINATVAGASAVLLLALLLA